MGGCQNYGPFLGTLNIRCRIIIGIEKRTIILTATHIYEATNEIPSYVEQVLSESSIASVRSVAHGSRVSGSSITLHLQHPGFRV